MPLLLLPTYIAANFVNKTSPTVEILYPCGEKWSLPDDFLITEKSFIKSSLIVTLLFLKIFREHL